AKGLRVTVPAGQAVSYGTVIPDGGLLSVDASKSKRFSGCSSYEIHVLGPSGEVASASACGTGEAFTDAIAGLAAGTYQVPIANLGPRAGSTTLAVYAFQDQPRALGAPTAAGTPFQARTTLPGQNAAATFSGIAGQRISTVTSAVKGLKGCSSYAVRLVRP